MRLTKFLSKHTISFFEKINPNLVFICTLLCFPSFLFLQRLDFIFYELIAFIFLTLIKRGKVKILPSIIMILGITFFAIFSPNGKIITSVNGNPIYLFNKFPVTSGAIATGLRKGFVLAGMVFLSQFAISTKMKLPGKIGIFMNSMFYTFGTLTEKKISFKLGHIIESIDTRLIEIWENQNNKTEIDKEEKHTYSALSFLIVLFPITLFVITLYSHVVS